MHVHALDINSCMYVYMHAPEAFSGVKGGHLQGEHGEGEVVDPEALLREALLHAEVLVHLAQQLRAALRQDALAPIQQLPYLHACGACMWGMHL
jgi:hypothetical protein